MEMDDIDYRYKPDGSPCEVGMLKFLGKTTNVQDLLAEYNSNVEVELKIPFSSARKRMTVAYYNRDTNTVRLIVKGAPEYLVPLCT